MPALYRNLKIRNKLLIAFLALIFIPLALITAITYQWSASAIKTNSEASTLDILSEVGRVVDAHYLSVERQYFITFTNSLVQDALNMANKGKLDEHERSWYSKKINDLLADIFANQEDLYSIYIISNVDNRILAGYPRNDLLGQYYRMTPGQRAAADLGMGSSVWMGLSANHDSVAWGRVINSLTTLRPIGYYMIYLNENALFDMFGGIKFSGARELFLMDADGTILSHRSKELLGTRADSGYARRVLFGGNQGFFEATVDGRASYVAYHTIKKTGWRIVSVIPAAQYDTQVIVLRNSMIIIALVCLIVISLFAVLLAAGLSRPIRALTSVVVRVRDGDIDMRSNYASRDEVGILSENFNQMIGQINALIYSVYEEELLKQKAELEALKFQINPHFLYNTLDTINWTARARGVPDVAELAKALGDMMRDTLSREDFALLRAEICSIVNYLKIQKARYGDRITVDMRISDRAAAQRIPKLILQPIVENAIVHGIEPMVEPGRIDIFADVQDDELMIRVSDNGMGIPAEKLSLLFEQHALSGLDVHTSIGVRNVNRRIKLYYGDQYGVAIESREGSGTQVTLRIPASVIEPAQGED